MSYEYPEIIWVPMQIIQPREGLWGKFKDFLPTP